MRAIVILTCLASAAGLANCRRRGDDDGRADGRRPKPPPSAPRAAGQPPSGATSPAPSPPSLVRTTRVSLADWSRLPTTWRTTALHSARAAEAGDRILYAQHHRHNLAVKDLLETLLIGRSELTPRLRQQLREYLSLLWRDHGHHDPLDRRKRAASFSPEELRSALLAALRRRINIGPRDAGGVERVLARLRATLFQPRSDARLVADLYRGVSLEQARRHRARFPHNARLVRQAGAVLEQPWRAGGAGAPEGVYVDELHHVIKHAARALASVPGGTREPGRSARRRLQALIEHLRSGARQPFERWWKLFVDTPAPVKLLLGFLPRYRDPLGMRGLYYGAVVVDDKRATAQLRRLLAWSARVVPRLGRPPAEPRPVEGLAVRVLFAAGAAASRAQPATLIVRGSAPSSDAAPPATLVLTDQPGPITRLLAGLLGDRPRCSAQLRFAWSALRAAIAARLGADEHPVDHDLHARVDAATLLLWRHPELQELGVVPDAGCARGLTDAYLRVCRGLVAADLAADNPLWPGCRGVVGHLDAGASAPNGTEPGVEQALVALYEAPRAPATRAPTTKPTTRPATSRPMSRPVTRFARALATLPALQSPVLVVRDDPVQAATFSARDAGDWLGYQLARSRAWRLQTGWRPLLPRVSPPARPGRVPPMRPLDQLQRRAE